MTDGQPLRFGRVEIRPCGRQCARSPTAAPGAQLNLRFSVLHWYEMVVSLGFAQGSRISEHSGRGWMLSLKIM